MKTAMRGHEAVVANVFNNGVPIQRHATTTGTATTYLISIVTHLG